MTARAAYPTWVTAAKSPAFAGKCLLYFLRTEYCATCPGHAYYKFGITKSFYRRMKKHYRDFAPIEVVRIFECPDETSMREIEQEFKKESAKSGILRTRYDRTEIIYVSDIQPYLDWVSARVSERAARVVSLVNLASPVNQEDYLAENAALRARIAVLEAQLRVLREQIDKKH